MSSLRAGTALKYQESLMDILVYIESHLDVELGLDLLAERANFSPYHFHRVFHQFVGENLKSYVRRLRLEQAAYRLKISQASVLDLALQAGYQTHESFTRAFARHFGMPPAAFRARYQHRRSYPTLRKTASTAMPNLELELFQPIHVAFIRHVGPYDSVLPEGASFGSAWDELFEWAETNGMDHRESLLVGIAHDDPNITPAEKIRFDVCMQVPQDFQPRGSIGFQTIQPGWYAHAKHTGPVEQIGETYQRLAAVLFQSPRYRMRLSPPVEIYSHTRVNEQIVLHHTHVYLAIEPMGVDAQTG